MTVYDSSLSLNPSFDLLGSFPGIEVWVVGSGRDSYLSFTNLSPLYTRTTISDTLESYKDTCYRVTLQREHTYIQFITCTFEVYTFSTTFTLRRNSRTTLVEDWVQ